MLLATKCEANHLDEYYKINVTNISSSSCSKMDKTDNYLNPDYATLFSDDNERTPPPLFCYTQEVVNPRNPLANTTAQGSLGTNIDGSHFSYLSISLSRRRQISVCNNSENKSVSSVSSSPANGSLASPSSSRGSSPLPPMLRRQSQSRPSSPPPATYLPSRRPSLSLPPSPRTLRTHRMSLPFLLPSGRVRSTSCNRGDFAAISQPTSRSNSPVSPSLISRNTRRRPARTPSPRPPLPPPTPSNDNPQIQQPQGNRHSSQPYKIKMRSR